MTWTTTTPTEPGWYWWRGGYYDAHPTMMRVIPDRKNLDVLSIADQTLIRRPIEAFDMGEWQGPLRPEE